MSITAPLRRVAVAGGAAQAVRRFSSSPASSAVWGFIGLGRMGYPMARNLRAKLPKGDTLIVNDINPDAPARLISELGGEGIKVAENVREVAEASETIITALPEPLHVRSVYAHMLKPPTLLNEGVSKERLFIDVSTIDPKSSEEVANATHSSGQGRYVDAPMSGGVVGAEKGALTFMTGAPPEVKDRVEEILMMMGKRVFFMGKPGAGLQGKLANNYLLALNNIATAEAMNLGVQLGLEPKRLAELINSCTGRCWPSEVNNPVPGVIEASPASRGYEGGFGSALQLKDLKLAMKAAEQAGVKIVLGEHAQALYEAVEEHPDCKGKDFSVVYRYLGGKE